MTASLRFIRQTGQTDRLVRAAAVSSAGTAFMLGSMFSGVPGMFMVGAVVNLAAMAYHSRAIRCPRCGYNLSWHGVSKVSLTGGSKWLLELDACPQCGLAPAAEAVSPVAAEPVPDPLPIAGAVFAAPPPSRPWAMPEPVAGKPAGSDYGYIEGAQAVPCSREALLKRYENGHFSRFVWTPAGTRATPFEEVPELLERYRAERTLASRYAHWGPIAFGLAMLIAMMWGPDPVVPGAGPAFWLGASVLVLGLRLHARRQAARLDVDGTRREMDDLAHNGWLATQPAMLTRVLMGCIGVVALAQLLPGDSLAGAGLVPERTASGEWWRLLSHGVLHVNAVHLAMNLLAMHSLGKLMEVHANRALLAPVLLAGILGGGLLGLAIGPDVPMAGVSGGLLGLVGFLTVLGFRRRSLLPSAFAKTMVIDIAFTAAVGLVGYRMIANAGHLGGLLAGLAMGALLIPPPVDQGRTGWTVGRAAGALGWACTAVLAGTCLATAAYLFLGR